MSAVDGSQDLLGAGTSAEGLWQTGCFRSPQLLAELAPERSESCRGLAVSVLHVLVLGKLLSQAISQPMCRYVHLLREAIDASAANECQLAVLVPPATMEHVEDIAGNLEKMPPKSTYFYPKLLSGLVFNPLKSS